MKLEESCLGLNQKNGAMATKGKASAMAYFAIVEEMVGKYVVNAIELDKIKATVMETILKKGDGRQSVWEG